jgi:hypothetical protein
LLLAVVAVEVVKHLTVVVAVELAAELVGI